MSSMAKKFVVKFDSNSTIQDNWARAISLAEAWYIYLDDDELRSQYQSANTQGAVYFAETLIKGAMIDRLYRGDLIAIGVAASNAQSEATPDLIPPNMFRQGVSRIDWDIGTVEGLGRIYYGVHVCSVVEPLSVSLPEPPIPAKRGRKSLTPLLIEAARSLLVDPVFDGMLREKQVNELQRRAAELHPAIFPNGTQPGRTTVYRFVAKQRAKSWRDCRNPENPTNPK